MLPLALSRPREALAGARAVLAGQPSPHEASVAHQARGIVLREFGDVQAGVRELRTALRLARQADSAGREADVLATLGVGLVYAGRTRDGLSALDRAIQLSDGVLAARVRASPRHGLVDPRPLTAAGHGRCAFGAGRAAARRRPAVDRTRAEHPGARAFGARVDEPGGHRFRRPRVSFSAEWARNLKRSTQCSTGRQSPSPPETSPRPFPCWARPRRAGGR